MAGQLIQLHNTYTAMDAFDSNPIMKPSELKLIQAVTSAPDIPAGTYLDVKSNITRKEIIFSPLLFHEGRLLFGEYDGTPESGQPICKSRDGLVPVIEEGLTPKATRCDICTLGMWRKNPRGGKDIKPPCGKTVSMLLVDKATTFPYWMVFKRTNYQPGFDFMIAVTRLLKMASVNGESLYSYNLEIKMTSVLVKKGYSYYVSSFGPMTPMRGDKATLALYKQLYEQAVTRKLMPDTPEPVVTVAKTTKPDTRKKAKTCPKKKRPSSR
jgi:hypothetical protein